MGLKSSFDKFSETIDVTILHPNNGKVIILAYSVEYYCWLDLTVKKVQRNKNVDDDLVRAGDITTEFYYE